MRLIVASVVIGLLLLGVVDLFRDVWYGLDLILNHITVK